MGDPKKWMVYFMETSIYKWITGGSPMTCETTSHPEMGHGWSITMDFRKPPKNWSFLYVSMVWFKEKKLTGKPHI